MERMPDGNTAALRRYMAEQDRLGELTAADEAAIFAAAEKSIRDYDWWNAELEGLSFCRTVAQCMAECMKHLDAAAAGDELARNAITTALNNARKTARGAAHDESSERFYNGKLEDE